MPLAKLKPSFPDIDAAPRAPLTTDLELVAAAPSPARVLQQRLERQTHVAVAASPDKWPLRQSAALIIGASLALWAAILAGVSQIYHAIA